MTNLAKSTVLGLTLAISAFVGSAQAQSSTSGYHVGNVHHQGIRFHSPLHYGYRFPTHGYGYRYPYDHRFGTAELIRAAAEASVLRAQARTQNLEADRLQMRNSVDFLHTRLERKRINKEARFGHLHRRGELVRAEKLVKAAAAPPEKPMVDTKSGQLNWPLLLRMDHYDKARQPIDLVFHERNVNGRVNPDHFLPMRDWIVKIEDELKSNVSDYEMRDYLDAKRFLRDLLDEAREDLPPAMSFQIAAN